MPSIHLTDITIQKLTLGPRTDYWDKQLPSFGLRVGGRHKVFIVKVKNKRLAIGRYPNLTLKEARRKAYVLLGSYVERGTMPFKDARDAFLREHCLKKNKPGTAAESKRLLNRFSFSCAIGKIMKRDILEQLRPLPPQEANHAFSAIRTMLNWCVEHDHLLHTPLHKARKPYEVGSRDRLLTDAEVKKIWQATFDHGTFGTIVRSLLLSGQRLNQIACFDDDWIHGDVIIFPGFIMKSNREHTIPLLSTLQQHLPSLPGPFGKLAYAMQALRDDLEGIPHWTLHDMRRYLSSTMSKLRVPIDITEAILDHRSGSRSEIQRIYDRDDRLPQMREALERYEAHVLAVVASGSTPHH